MKNGIVVGWGKQISNQLFYQWLEIKVLLFYI
jgi:hypothetical protein